LVSARGPSRPRHVCNVKPLSHTVTGHNSLEKQTNSVALSPQANYTDWSTATCRRNLVPTFVDRWVLRDQRGGSPSPEPLLFFQAAPQLSSRGWVDPIPDLLLLRKSGSAVNQTRDLWVTSQELWPLDHRDSPYFLRTWPKGSEGTAAGATAQEINRWLLITGAQIQSQANYVAIVVNKVTLRQSIFRVLRFPWQILIPPMFA
jgi:hypothetical protein